MLLIKNGTVLKDDALVQEDIRIQDGRIVRIAPGLEAQEGEEVLDASGLTVLPGLIDVHVHLREPGYEKRKPSEPAQRLLPTAALPRSLPCPT